MLLKSSKKSNRQICCLKPHFIRLNGSGKVIAIKENEGLSRYWQYKFMKV